MSIHIFNIVSYLVEKLTSEWFKASNLVKKVPLKQHHLQRNSKSTEFGLFLLYCNTSLFVCDCQNAASKKRMQPLSATNGTPSKRRNGASFFWVVWTIAAIKPRLLVFKAGFNWWCVSLPPDIMWFNCFRFSSKILFIQHQCFIERCEKVLSYLNYHGKRTLIGATDRLLLYFLQITRKENLLIMHLT